MSALNSATALALSSSASDELFCTLSEVEAKCLRYFTKDSCNGDSDCVWGLYGFDEEFVERLRNIILFSMEVIDIDILTPVNCGSKVEKSARQQWCSIDVARDTRSLT